MDKDDKALGKKLVADWNALLRIFIRPEDDAAKATLVKYMQLILFELNDFLKEHVGITEAISLPDLCNRYQNTIISKNPEEKLADVINSLIKEVAPCAVNVSSPYFVGHMTSAIPFFMVHLKTIVAALNQNVVKLETSKVVSVIEKLVLAKMHRMIYNLSDGFYDKHVQNPNTTLGCFTEGGTTANYTALWVARNTALGPKDGCEGGVGADGIMDAYRAHGIKRSVILVSRRGHYSFRKAGGLLGIGNHNLIAVNVDSKHRIDIDCLHRKMKEIKNEGRTKILAIVGVAGTTETGSIDPLQKLSEISAENSIHFHVDAAWGGPTLMSEKYGRLLKGIEHADSVTIDGHKQFYMPMSCGMVYFKDPNAMDSIAYHANYVNRRGSVDLGIKSLAGSREANSLILYSALKIMGSNGYALLLEHGIELAREFAQEIEKRDLFQLVTYPELNIITYRIYPKQLVEQAKQADSEQKKLINKKLDAVNRIVQRIQRESGLSFVSRTTLTRGQRSDDDIVVLRCVIMNPMTNMKILNEILDEQENIYRQQFENA